MLMFAMMTMCLDRNKNAQKELKRDLAKGKVIASHKLQLEITRAPPKSNREITSVERVRIENR